MQETLNFRHKKADPTHQDVSASIKTHIKGNNMNTLTFNEVNFNPIERNGQIWLTSKEIAKALGYKNATSINKIYNTNSDEFTDTMSLTTDTVVDGINNSKRRLSIRIFSLRGCHLLAMFARTDIAKQFRKWVLDILDKEVGAPVQVNPIATISAEQQHLIRKAVSKKCKSVSAHYQTVYNKLYEHFGIPRYTELLAVDFEDAIRFISTVELSNQNDNNEFWRYVGVIKYQELTQVLVHAKDVADTLSKAISNAQNHTGLIFDAFDGQHRTSGLGKDGHRDAYAKAQAFIERQDARKRIWDGR